MTSYHMVFKNGYFGSINKCGGLPTHLPEIWPQIDGADLAFLFQLYCDGEKLNIPNTLCIQGYQLFENGDYNSDIVVIQLPLDAKENIQQVGLSCPVSPDYAGGDIEFEVVEEQDNYDLDDLNVDDFYRWTKMGVPCSKLLGWCEKEIIPSNCAFLGWLADEDPLVLCYFCIAAKQLERGDQNGYSEALRQVCMLYDKSPAVTIEIEYHLANILFQEEQRDI